MSRGSSNKVARKVLVPAGLSGIGKLRLGVTSVELSDIDVVYSCVEKMGGNFGRYVTDRCGLESYREDDLIRIYFCCKNKFITYYSCLIFESLNKITDRRVRNKVLRNLVRVSDAYVHPPF